MDDQELLKDILRLRLKMADRFNGMLPVKLAEGVREFRHEVLTAVHEATGEYLKQNADSPEEGSMLQPIRVE